MSLNELFSFVLLKGVEQRQMIGETIGGEISMHQSQMFAIVKKRFGKTARRGNGTNGIANTFSSEKKKKKRKSLFFVIRSFVRWFVRSFVKCIGIFDQQRNVGRMVRFRLRVLYRKTVEINVENELIDREPFRPLVKEI